MNCQRVRERLNDLIDGATPADERRDLEHHLRQCAACAEEKRRLRKLVADLGALPTSLEPPRELWPAIDRRLDDRTPTAGGRAWWARWQPLLAAAALVVAVVSIGLMMRAVNGGGARPGAPPPGVVRAPLASAGQDATGFVGAEQAFRVAKQQLREELEEHRGSLAPSTLAVIDENLEIMDGAIREIEGALARDPGNPELQRMLVATHNRQLGLLKQVTQFASKRQRSE